MKTFKLIWKTGESEIAKGINIRDAFTNKGYSYSAIKSLDYYEELREEQIPICPICLSDDIKFETKTGNGKCNNCNHESNEDEFIITYKTSTDKPLPIKEVNFDSLIEDWDQIKNAVAGEVQQHLVENIESFIKMIGRSSNFSYLAHKRLSDV